MKLSVKQVIFSGVVLLYVLLSSGCTNPSKVATDDYAKNSSVKDPVPTMPVIPVNIAETAKKMDIGKCVWGWTVTENEIKYCGLDSKSSAIIVHEFRDDSVDPVVIQNTDGKRRIASIECTHLLTNGSKNMEIGIIFTYLSTKS